MPKPDDALTPELGERSIAEIIADLTWEDIVADGITTMEEIEAQIIADGGDPTEYDHLYD